MKEITLPISQLFNIIRDYEKISFVPEQEQFLNTEIQIKDEHDNWISVNAAITKETTGRKIAFDTGDEIAAADKHLIHDGEECVYLDSLQPGDVIRKQDGTEAIVTGVIPISDILFYDLSVLSNTHLYQTTNGFVHHNTELAKLLSEHLSMPLLKYDMSEYQEKHSVAALIGAPPGYVGYDDSNLGGGKLISDLSKNPHSIILLDEIEKAHQDVYNLLLQLLDEGTITSTNGKRANAKNCIVIMTSNMGASDSERLNIGFGDQRKTGEDDRALKDTFKPELRNRIDLICKFKRLDTFAIKKIVNKFTNDLKRQLQQHDLQLQFSEPVIEYLAREGYDEKLGARPLSRKIDELIRVPLSKKIIFEKLKNATVYVALVEDKIVFNVVNKVTEADAMVGPDGIVTIH